jgi:hypothetical protein
VAQTGCGQQAICPPGEGGMRDMRLRAGKNADIASRFLVFFGKYNDLDDRIGEDLRNEINHLTEHTLRCVMEDGRDDQISSRDQ